MMRSSVSTNADKVAEWTKNIAKQIPYATALAMNTLAFKARSNAKMDISKAFKSPTKFTQSAVQVNPAKKTDRKVVIGIGSGIRTGKAGDPRSSYLAASIKGGLRGQKRVEKGLFRGLGSSFKMWMPAKGEKLNKFGNMPRARQMAIAKGVVNKGSTLHNRKYFAKGNVIYEKYGRGLKSMKPVVVLFNNASYTKRLEFHKPIRDLYRKEFSRTFHTQWNYLLRKDGLTAKGSMISTTVGVK